MKIKHSLSLIILGLIVLILSFEVLRDTFTKGGDFIGYVLVGNLVMDSDNIYKQPAINTWPPFFSVVSVPIAIADNFNKYLIRFIWLVFSVIAMFHIVRYTIKMTISRDLKILPLKLSAGITKGEISITHWIVLVPVLIILRYVLDNLSNIQINIFMLFFTVLGLYYFSKGRDVLAALVLAFAISVKVYPVFLFLYFVVKREYKIVLFTILFCLLFGGVPFLVFGVEQAIDYYAFWFNNNVANFTGFGHKNQSFFAMVGRILTNDGMGLAPLKAGQVKIVSYTVIAAAGSLVVFLFRKKIDERSSLKIFLEYAFVVTVIPVLSPLAWKAYFIFLFPAYLINYLFIFQFKNSLSNFVNNYLKITYYISIALTVFSSELFLGKYLSDVAEAFSCITIGSILAAINILIFYSYYHKYDTSLKFDAIEPDVI